MDFCDRKAREKGEESQMRRGRCLFPQCTGGHGWTHSVSEATMQDTKIENDGTALGCRCWDRWPNERTLSQDPIIQIHFHVVAAFAGDVAASKELRGSHAHVHVDQWHENNQAVWRQLCV